MDFYDSISQLYDFIEIETQRLILIKSLGGNLLPKLETIDYCFDIIKRIVNNEPEVIFEPLSQLEVDSESTNKLKIELSVKLLLIISESLFILSKAENSFKYQIRKLDISMKICLSLYKFDLIQLQDIYWLPESYYLLAIDKLELIKMGPELPTNRLNTIDETTEKTQTLEILSISDTLNSSDNNLEMGNNLDRPVNDLCLPSSRKIREINTQNKRESYLKIKEILGKGYRLSLFAKNYLIAVKCIYQIALLEIDSLKENIKKYRKVLSVSADGIRFLRECNTKDNINDNRQDNINDNSLYLLEIYNIRALTFHQLGLLYCKLYIQRKRISRVPQQFLRKALFVKRNCCNKPEDSESIFLTKLQLSISLLIELNSMDSGGTNTKGIPNKISDKDEEKTYIKEIKSLLVNTEQYNQKYSRQLNFIFDNLELLTPKYSLIRKLEGMYTSTSEYLSSWKNWAFTKS